MTLGAQVTNATIEASSGDLAPSQLSDPARRFSREYLVHHRVAVSRVDSEAVCVAVVGDSVPEAIDDISFVFGRRVICEQVDPAELDVLIDRMVAATEYASDLERLPQIQLSEAQQDDLGADVRDLATQPPVIRYVNTLVRDAYEAGASDIHLDAAAQGLVTRFRLDGVLVPSPASAAPRPEAVISRIKLLAELDIAERRRPQDGRIRVRLLDRELDLRVSTVPTLFGESVVIRLLDRGGRPVALESLGMSDAVLQNVTRLAARSHGMMVVTGPTGSGKTTTLYAAISRRTTGAEKIITVEDPVEYQLAGVAQVPVHQQANVTMSSVLRSILRQDPDVIMIGEMRDGETAEVAVQAAMTGHLVFSTLHTTDAISAVPRLMDLGIPDYLVSATLDAVLAQRLVRRICEACRVSYEPGREQLAKVVGDVTERIRLTRGAGCPRCRGTGFRGRLGLFELLVLTDEIKEAVATGVRSAGLAVIAAEEGMATLRADGWAKVRAGLTTVDEVLRVINE